MLIKTLILNRIKAGKITLIFRRWKKPGVKAGGTQMTQRGVLAIDAVDVVTERKITEQDAVRCRFRIEKRAACPDDRTRRTDRDLPHRGSICRRRPAKRASAKRRTFNDEIADIIAKLRKLDAGSQRGNWTAAYLQMIHDQPNTHAAILAEQIGLDIPRFKPWVRKLKALGLTESLRPGYRLSPRGEKILAALRLRRSS